jgi:hypothetical protein
MYKGRAVTGPYTATHSGLLYVLHSAEVNKT